MRWLWLAWIGVFLLGLGIGVRLPQSRVQAETACETDTPLRYTTLVCRELVCYDSPFLDEEEQMGITALVLTNTGSVGIRYTNIRVIRNGQLLSFEAEYIPAGATVLVPEVSGAPYQPGEMEDCRCVTVIPAVLDGMPDGVTVEADGTGLRVTNGSEKTVSSLRVYYGYYDAQGDICVGLPHRVEITGLRSGESRRVCPEYYAPGNTVILTVEAE